MVINAKEAHRKASLVRESGIHPIVFEFIENAVHKGEFRCHASMWLHEEARSLSERLKSIGFEVTISPCKYVDGWSDVWVSWENAG